MNQQLVESIAQIVLAMTAEERQHFERLVGKKPSNSASQNGSQPTVEQSKDEQIAQIAQQMQDFEEKHATPLAPLPDDLWRV